MTGEDEQADLKGKGKGKMKAKAKAKGKDQQSGSPATFDFLSRALGLQLLTFLAGASVSGSSGTEDPEKDVCRKSEAPCRTCGERLDGALRRAALHLGRGGHGAGLGDGEVLPGLERPCRHDPRHAS